MACGPFFSRAGAISRVSALVEVVGRDGLGVCGVVRWVLVDGIGVRSFPKIIEEVVREFSYGTILEDEPHRALLSYGPLARLADWAKAKNPHGLGNG